jgi:ABC-type antimicrobial peptide transport system permease subunit
LAAIGKRVWFGDVYQRDAADGLARGPGPGADTFLAPADRSFSTIAALLAGVGLYGVLTTSVRQRTAEIGVRMALGAAPARIFRLLVGKGLYLSVIGIVIGLLAALALTRVLASMLVEVKPTDPVTFVSVAVLFLFIAVMASWLPALRAARLDPTTALRSE